MTFNDKKLTRGVSSILEAYHPCVETLGEYLGNIVDLTPYTRTGEERRLISPDDTITYTALLDTSYVGSKGDKSKTFRFHPPMLDMREIIDQAQTRLFKTKRPQNIITSGYRLASRPGDQGRAGMARMGITNHFINTIITVFQAPEWTTLLNRVGEDPMLHLLTDTSIFISLPNGCLCQVTGEPIIHLIPKPLKPLVQRPSSSEKRTHGLIEDVDIDQSRKRRKIQNSTKSQTKKVGALTCHSPADIPFIRVRLFYSQPNYIPGSNQILVGLPLKHVLNRLYPSYRRERPDENVKKWTDDIRRISKYIFARQYGLNTPLSSALPKGFSNGVSGYDYMDREFEIKIAGPSKTPKRLKSALYLIEKLLRRHSRCAYLSLMDRSCPSKVKRDGNKELDSVVILELMSETSIQLQSQIVGADSISFGSSGVPVSASGLTQAQAYAKSKPRFFEFACSYVEVYRYIALVTKTIIPRSFWGSKANLNLVLKHVKTFIACRRYETLTLHHVLQQFSTCACDWLGPSSANSQQQRRVSVSDSLKRRELLEDFLFWYFDSFVLPLLRTTFYVTESSAFRNQVLYFRHDDWAVLCAPLIQKLTSLTFEKLPDDDATEILRQRKLGFSFVRLLPKDTGVRPIVNLRKRKAMNRGSFTSQQSINQVLQAAFSILTFERTNQPQLIGASAFSRDDVYCKLKKLKAALPQDAQGKLPRLYFVKVDVQSCFDTIDQTKLLKILQQLISEDVYMTQKYGQISVSLNKVKRTYVKKAVPEDEQPHFLRHAANLAGALRNTIFVDQVVYPVSKKQEILELLEEHITENIVKIGQDYYRQTVGIPQGSVLSSILCSFFYGDLEKNFSKFMADPHSALLRLVDDYLFITTRHDMAVEFLDRMNDGHPEYGCSISPEKTLTNFDYRDNVLNIIENAQQTFPWCGYLINMCDLSVTVDYTRYHGSGIGNTLTVDRGRKPGAVFCYKMLQLAKAKSHIIFCDMHLNTEHVVYLNIYQNLLLIAIKMHKYLLDWSRSGKRNIAFLRNVIEKTINYNYTTCRRQAQRTNTQQLGSDCEIHRGAVTWLGQHAFHHVLSRKAHQYKSLLIWLQFELRRGKFRSYHKQFKKMIERAQIVFGPIIR